MKRTALTAILVLLTASICLAALPPDKNPQKQPKDTSQIANKKPPEHAPNKLYPFAFNYNENYTILRLYPTPKGYERYPENKMSMYQAWLTNLPIWPDQYTVALWNENDTVKAGRVAAVLDLGVRTPNQTGVNIPLQLLWTARRVFNKPNEIEYILSPKDTVTYTHWLSGKYGFDGAGNLVFRPGEKREHSDKDYFRFLEFAMHQNTPELLAYNSKKIDPKNIAPGDLYIQYKDVKTDSVGHTAIILDVCTNKSGDVLVIPAWGGNPAHSVMIPKSSNAELSPWMNLDELRDRLAQYGPGQFYNFARK